MIQIGRNQEDFNFDGNMSESLGLQSEEERKRNDVSIYGENFDYHESVESVITLCISQDDDTINLPNEKEQEEICSKEIRFSPSNEEEDNNRARTAPARTLSEIEKLRNSNQFIYLEAAIISSSQLIQSEDGKFDLDSFEGQRCCKCFLQELERLLELYKIPHAWRKYREQFSQAYRVLYNKDELCYLTEILDSAQDAVPFLWVNSEKYVFSLNVVKSAKELFNFFRRLQKILRSTYHKLCEDSPKLNIKQTITEFRLNLYNFDKAWTKYERVILYINP